MADAVVVITSLTLELTLRGIAQEVASLLIFFRLWRILRVMHGVAGGRGGATRQGCGMTWSGRHSKERRGLAVWIRLGPLVLSCKAGVQGPAWHPSPEHTPIQPPKSEPPPPGFNLCDCRGHGT